MLILILRRLSLLSMVLLLCLTTIACGSDPDLAAYRSQEPTYQTSTQVSSLPSGRYPVQQVTYNDATGEYSVVLLNTPSGTPPVFRTQNLPLARLSDADIQSGQKSYLQSESGEVALYLTEDFRIEYIHNVTDTQVNSQTGERETVVIRQEPSFWTPFAGALAGQAIGSLLFRPHYYLPPVYQPGGYLRGFGGYGQTYGQAIQQYQDRYQAPPPVVINRQARLRTTGQLRYPIARQPSFQRTRPSGNRSTGSGFGTSTLRPSRTSSSRYGRTPSFGSSGRRSLPNRSFGSQRR